MEESVLGFDTGEMYFYITIHEKWLRVLAASDEPRLVIAAQLLQAWFDESASRLADRPLSVTFPIFWPPEWLAI